METAQAIDFCLNYHRANSKKKYASQLQIRSYQTSR